MEKLDQKGTLFQKSVWREIAHIPKGKTITYKELADKISKPTAIRAVANAVGKNKLLIKIPCHRVVRSDGKIGGYSGLGGVKEKLRLLQNEGVDVSKMRE